MRNLAFALVALLALTASAHAKNRCEQFSGLAKLLQQNKVSEVSLNKQLLDLGFSPEDAKKYANSMRRKLDRNAVREVHANKEAFDALTPRQRAAREVELLAQKYEKPTYTNPGTHDKTSTAFRGRGESSTTLLPDDAATAFKKAVPDPKHPDQTWWSCVVKGKNKVFYRYQVNGKNQSQVHWNGSTEGKLAIPDQAVNQAVKTYFDGLCR